MNGAEVVMDNGFGVCGPFRHRLPKNLKWFRSFPKKPSIHGYVVSQSVGFVIV